SRLLRHERPRAAAPNAYLNDASGKLGTLLHEGPQFPAPVDIDESVLFYGFIGCGENGIGIPGCIGCGWYSSRVRRIGSGGRRRHDPVSEQTQGVLNSRL